MVDEPSRARRPLAKTAQGIAIALLPLALGACGGSGSAEMLAPTQRLTADDFRSDDAQATDTPRPIPAYIAQAPRAPRVAIRSLTEEQARGGVQGIDVTPGEPANMGTPAPRPGDRDPATQPAEVGTAGLNLVDAKIGDLNGVPIIAGAWLEQLGPRLRAESAGKTRAEWAELAFAIIRERLTSDLRDELLLAEARSSLTAQQKAGLRVFLSRFEKDVVRSSYGSQTLADEQLRATSGLGLDEAVRERERLALINTEGQKIVDRIQVPWRDIQREYERRYKEFNPDPRAVFRLIRLSDPSPEVVTEFTSALAASDFNTVAEDERNLDQQAERVFGIETTFEETEFFGIEELQTAAISLSPGEYAGPIVRGSSTFWLYLDRVEQESRSLYEVQQQLLAELTNERRDEEFSRYLLRLFDRAGITNIDELVFRLVVIAEQWYYESQPG